jgi:hypothetical protein
MHIFPSPSVRRIATSAEESHPLNSVPPLATILNDVFTFSVGGTFLKLHCLFAYNAVQETYQRASGALARDHFLFAFSLDHFNGSPIM